MKNSIHYIICLIMLSCLSACLNYETQEDGPYSDDDLTEDNLNNSVVYVANGEVYLSDPFFENATLINSDNNNLASINNKHTKLLFKSPNQNIQIYDIDSKAIEGEIPETEDAFWFDYHNNDETVYYLIGDEIFTFGKSVLEESPLNLPNLTQFPSANLSGAAMGKNDEIIFSLEGGPGNVTESYAYRYSKDIEYNNGLQDTYVSGVNSVMQFLRTNKDGTSCWGTNVQDGRIIKISTNSSLAYRGDISNAKLGVPISYDNGFVVYPNNSIDSFNQGVTPFPGVNITAIDF